MDHTNTNLCLQKLNVLFTGNWHRYYALTKHKLKNLDKKFKHNKIPFSKSLNFLKPNKNVFLQVSTQNFSWIKYEKQHSK
jgi:hypothetical protein